MARNPKPIRRWARRYHRRAFLEILALGEREAEVGLVESVEAVLERLRKLRRLIPGVPPWPGSLAARRLGCCCPRLDNEDLSGTGLRVISGRCPIHARQ
jgi:hypothetical protein